MTPDLERFDAVVCAHGLSGRAAGDRPVDACIVLTVDGGWTAK